MMYAILTVAALFCAAKWTIAAISLRAVLKYLFDNGVKPPSDKEMSDCCRWAVKKMLGIKR